VPAETVKVLGRGRGLSEGSRARLLSVNERYRKEEVRGGKSKGWVGDPKKKTPPKGGGLLGNQKTQFPFVVGKHLGWGKSGKGDTSNDYPQTGL